MRIAVLYGGTSAERNVSLASGRAVGAALADAGHEVLLVDPAIGDRPVGVDEAVVAEEIGCAPPDPTSESGSAVAAVSGEAVAKADVVFVALHGGTGEDGTVQGLLQLAGKRYTGSGVLACAAAMDKRLSKMLLRAASVPTPDWRMLVVGGDSGSAGAPVLPDDIAIPGPGADGGGDALVLEAVRPSVRALGGYPVVVKPNDQGSTVGLTIVRDESSLPGAVRVAAGFSPRVLVESFIPGRELTVAVLGDRPLPVVEISPLGGLYDYESKYTAGRSEYTCPARLPGEAAGELSRLAVRACRSLGCTGYARVDFRLDEGRPPSCLEVNTVPGMTATSLVPMAAEAAGMSFAELVDRIVRLAAM